MSKTKASATPTADPAVTLLLQIILKIIVAGGILAAVYAVWGDAFISMLLMVALPILGVAYAFRLISWAGLQALLNGDFHARVRAEYEKLQAQHAT